ncbi:hypothetical protein K4F52_000958 [Lecanicillium sp. MT-2017a]|nr:hypothetical protein K4F52_000958 [Lecanicillium sp. MT-2017a]
MTGFLLRIAAADRSVSSLHDHHRLIRARHLRAALTATAAATKRANAPTRLRLRRATAANLAPCRTLHHGHHGQPHSRSRSGSRSHARSRSRSNSLSHRRRRSFDSRIHSFNPFTTCSDPRSLLQSYPRMASCNEIRRRSSAADRNPLDAAGLASPPASTATTTTFSPTPDAIASPPMQPTACHQSNGVGLGLTRDSVSENDSQAMPPPPRPFGEVGSPVDPLSPSRRRFAHSRAHSTASVTRQANRLSLTLPIAPQRTETSRPQPSAAPVPTATSKPPTPAQTPVLGSLEDANDFIIAIAAQERKVLELREELSRAEADLTCLKTQWAAKESMQKRTVEIQATDSPRQTATPDGASSPSRRSVDLDRRKLLLQSQNNTPTTPTQGRRRVIRGGHTRTLSLLSPARPDTGFPVHEDSSIDAVLHQKQQDQTLTQNHTPTLTKRATWQPRTQPPPSGVPQIVEDFRLGIRAFVEDIRQITVGEEPISGQASPRSTATPSRPARSRNQSLDDRTVTRSKVSPAFDSVTSGPSLPPKNQDVLPAPERAKTAKSKRFSWTPPGIDTLDDDDWESWDSPPTSKSSRWSGSTMHGAGIDDIQAIPETADEATTPL